MTKIKTDDACLYSYVIKELYMFIVSNQVWINYETKNS